jgi:DNA-binding transcriptional ArsR family regulator
VLEDIEPLSQAAASPFTPTRIDTGTIYRALANPTRRKILSWLREPGHFFAEQDFSPGLGVNATTIGSRCGLAQSVVSVHLSVLSRAGLVISKKVSQSVFFRRNEDTLRAFSESVLVDL